MRKIAANLKIVSAADETELVWLRQPTRPPSLPVFVHGCMCKLHVESTVCVCVCVLIYPKSLIDLHATIQLPDVYIRVLCGLHVMGYVHVV